MSYGLYIHIPYCKSRCRYCDFYTAGASGGVPQPYIEAILREFAHLAPKTPDGTPQSPSTVYFGGGTPGLLTGAQVAQLLAAFSPVAGAEITLETNPETISPEGLTGWLEAGVNRLSIGVQTADDTSLERLGRMHTAKTAAKALQLAKQAGFTNISGDMMLALPHYTEAEFDRTLAMLVEGGVTHISGYLLTIEGGTPFGQNPPKGLPNDDTSAEFYEYAVQQLGQVGFPRYEISNFAQQQYEGQHNLRYWACENYLGLGPAAHSCMEGRRFYFVANTSAFIAGSLPPVADGRCTAEDFIMLQLRLERGLNTAELERRFGQRLSLRQRGRLQAFAQHGLAKATPMGWQLTTNGLLVQNALLADLLAGA